MLLLIVLKCQIVMIDNAKVLNSEVGVCGTTALWAVSDGSECQVFSLFLFAKFWTR